MKKLNVINLIRTVFTFIILLNAPLHAQSATGSVIGRVQNAETEDYIYGARVRVVSIKNQQTGESAAVTDAKVQSTDESGTFRIDGISSGEVMLAVTYQGMPTVTVPAVIETGKEILIPDVQMRHTRAGNDLVKLDAFQVSVARDMSNREIAVNTQRYADNFKTVIAANDLGFIADGSIANALKYLPGVEMETDNFGYGTTISMSGAPSSSVPITFGGFSMTTSSDNSQGPNGAGSPGTGSPGNGGSAAVRSTQLMTLSLNNISRIEVNHTTLPDDPGSALAGSINFVPKSAFELSRPQYEFALYGAAEQNQLKNKNYFGPGMKTISTKFPGFNFSSIVPINKKIGFSVNFSTNTVPKYTQKQNLYWNANYDTKNAVFLATPLIPDHYTLNYDALDNLNTTYSKTNINLTLDYKLSSHGTLSASFTQAYNVMDWADNQLRWGSTNDVNLILSSLDKEVGNYTPSTGSSNLGQNTNSQQGICNNVSSWNRDDTNKQFFVQYRYNYDGWKINLGSSYGASRQQYRNLDAPTPIVFNSFYNMRPLQVFELYGINQNGFTSAKTVSLNGTVVNPADVNTFAAAGGFNTNITYQNGVSGTSFYSTLPPERIKPLWASDHTAQFKGDLTRDLKLDGTIFKNIPTSIKLGFDYKQYSRDQRLDPALGNNGQGFMYTGTQPLSAFTSPYPNTFYGGFGGPGSTAINNVTVAKFWLANQSTFLEGRPYSDFSANIQYNNRIMERIGAGYLRLDSQLLGGKLKMSYGIRSERTMDNGAGALIKNGGKQSYLTNSLGQVINAQSGSVYKAGANDPVTGALQTPALLPATNTVAWAQTVFTQLASLSQHNYNNWFPSATASYNVTQNVIARVSFSTTVGRPDFNSLYPSLQTPDPTLPPAANSNQFVLNNTGLKPWMSHNYGVSLEYYSPDNQWNVTLRAYRRFVSNPWNTNQVLSPTDGQAIMQEYGINPNDWSGYYVQTAINEPSVVTTSGYEFSGNYQLDRMLPVWARGLGIRVAGTRATQTGGGLFATAFTAQNLALIPWALSGGVSLTRERFQFMVNAKWNSTQRLTYNDWLTGSGQFAPGSYTYLDPTLHVDLDLSIRLTQAFSFFLNGRDMNGFETQTRIYSPITPNYAKKNQFAKYQPVWTAGIKAKF